MSGPALRAIGNRASHVAAIVFVLMLTRDAVAQPAIPELTQPVNDFAGIVDPDSVRELDRMIRSLQRATNDVVVVATIQTFSPYPDIREYAVKMFENHGRGIGERGKDNGLLVLVALNERRVWVEVGYDLEQFVTDGFAGETARDFMTPAFREGNYGAGLRAGVARIISRIAEGRNVVLDGVEAPTRPVGIPTISISPGAVIFVAIALFFFVSRVMSIANRRNRRRRRYWGGRPWSGWHSGVGPFGSSRGGFGGGFGGFGGSSGGFGGFSGGRSGGGGGGAGW